MISENIKQLRKQNKMTQEQLADKIGVKRAIISKYESGKVEPSITQIQNIATALNASMEDLLGIKIETAIGYDDSLITEEILDEEREIAYLAKLDDFLANMTPKYKDLYFQLSLAMAEGMAQYVKGMKSSVHKQTDDKVCLMSPTAQENGE